MSFLVAPSTVVPDFDVRTASHSVLVELSPSVPQVRTGTPLTPGPDGWVIAPKGVGAKVFASQAARGGERVAGFVQLTLTASRKMFTVGTYSIRDIDDTGLVSFEPDPKGEYVALSPTEMLLR